MKPILFNTEMVKAILEGRKTCTRRSVKGVTGLDFIGTSSEDGSIFDHVAFGHGNFDDIVNAKIEKRIKAPYLPGDILYVRETFFEGDILDSNEDIVENGIVLYAADELRDDLDPTEMKWQPSIHMPKRLARIFLKVTNVRVEKIQDITEEGARKEGCIDFSDRIGDGKFEDVLEFDLTAKDAFIELWDSTVNKKDIDLYGWDSNPWVWIIEFKKLDNYKILDTIH